MALEPQKWLVVFLPSLQLQYVTVPVFGIPILFCVEMKSKQISILTRIARFCAINTHSLIYIGVILFIYMMYSIIAALFHFLFIAGPSAMSTARVLGSIDKQKVCACSYSSISQYIWSHRARSDASQFDGSYEATLDLLKAGIHNFDIDVCSIERDPLEQLPTNPAESSQDSKSPEAFFVIHPSSLNNPSVKLSQYQTLPQFLSLINSTFHAEQRKLFEKDVLVSDPNLGFFENL